MAKLSPAYEEAVDKLKKTDGSQVAFLVRAVLISESNLADFNEILKELSVSEERQDELGGLLIDQIATDIATMCLIAHKHFKVDILPLINKAKEGAKGSKHLQ